MSFPALHMELSNREIIEPHLDEILYRVSIGMPFTAIVADLELPINSTSARVAVRTNWPAAYQEARIGLAHHLIEQTLVSAENADNLDEASGYRTASDIRMKVAALLAPDEYLDKKRLELTGKDGGPIESSDLPPDEAYKRMLKG